MDFWAEEKGAPFVLMIQISGLNGRPMAMDTGADTQTWPLRAVCKK